MALISGFRHVFGSSAARCAVPSTRRLSTNIQLFVGGLSFETNEQVLKDAFGRFGQLLEVRVLVNRDTGRSKGCGFVHFASEMEADNARKEMDGKQLDGRNIRVEFPNSRPLRIGGACSQSVVSPSNLNKESYIEVLDD